jgi:nucleoside-diphosphate-sugar epimerase
MNVWVTGATGFVGGATARRLAARGDRVVAIARPSSAHLVDRARFTLAVADLPELDALDGAPPPDAIVHCAAEISPDGPDAERRSRAAHVDATLALAERARRAGARFVHLSTTDVYRDETAAASIDEDSAIGRSARYGRTKLEGESRLREAAPDAVILRPPGVYGPESRGDYVQTLIRKIARGWFVYFGDGRERRSWVFVENLVDAIERAVDGRVPAGTYLIDDGAPVSRRELVDSIDRALRASTRYVHVPVPVAYALARSLEVTWPRIGRVAPLTTRGVRFLSEGFPLDTRRLRATGFAPSWTFDRAIEATVRWVQGHR